MNRQIVRRMVEPYDWTVLEARDGGEALQMVASASQVDLLITDVQMPVMDGTQLARAARLLRPRLKVLFVTGYSDMLFAGTSVLEDHEAFLEKPCTRESLIEAVSILCFGTVQPLGDTNRPWASRLLASVHPRQVQMLRQRMIPSDGQYQPAA